ITMPLNTAALNSLPRDLASHGSAVNNTVRQLSGAVGTAVIVTIYSTQLKNVMLDVTESSPLATAAGNTYLYMLIVACVAFVLAWFTPKMKRVEKKTT